MADISIGGHSPLLALTSAVQKKSYEERSFAALLPKERQQSAAAVVSTAASAPVAVSRVNTAAPAQHLSPMASGYGGSLFSNDHLGSVVDVYA